MLIKAALALTLALPTVIGEPIDSSAGSIGCWDTAWRCRDVNEVRADNGRPPLDQSAELQASAKAWAVSMADDGILSHSFGGYSEAVGMGPDFATILVAFMDSPAHRAILLDRDARHVGFGVARVDGTLWVAVQTTH